MNIYKYIENLSLFVETAKSQSFSAVARHHGVSPSSVMRKIDLLEFIMKVPLFVRTNQGVFLTEVGNSLFVRATKILKDLNEMTHDIVTLNEETSGSLRISCLPTFARLHIFPWLTQFKLEYPNLNLALDLTERLENPSIEHLDAVIRIGEFKSNSLYATKLAEQKWIACASPDYLTQYGIPDGYNNLAGHYILDKYEDPNNIAWGRILDTKTSKYQLFMRCNDFDVLRKSAVSGLGIAFLPNWVVFQDIRSGKLIKIFDDPQEKVENIYFMRSLPKMSLKLSIFLQYLRNNLADVLL